MHYVVTIDIKRVDDVRPAGNTPRGLTDQSDKRGPVTDVAHIVIKDSELERLKTSAGQHIQLVSDNT